MVKNQNSKKLEGIIPALITPMEEKGEINFQLLEKQAAYLSEAGVHGIFVNGTTSEGAYLSTKEKIEVFKLVKSVTQGRQILCAACIQSSTRMTIEEIRAFESLEPDFIVAVAPFYINASQEVIIQHYREIARTSEAPVIIYNIPQCTHNNISLSTIVDLAEVENISAIKDSSGDFISFSRGLLSEVPSHFSWIQGEDYLDGPSLILGAQGIVTGLGNVRIEEYVEMYRAAEQGNASRIIDCQKKINSLYEIIRITGGKVLPAIKAGASLFGRSEKWLRTSSMTLTEDEIEDVKQVLLKLGLL